MLVIAAFGKGSAVVISFCCIALTICVRLACRCFSCVYVCACVAEAVISEITQRDPDKFEGK